MFDDQDNTVMIQTFSAGSFFADRYRIDNVLGTGAMGRVYDATELHSGRRVALKVLHRERLGEADTMERFRREAEVLASIGHPCIVEIYTFHHTPDGTPYLAMEILEGVTLKTRLQEGGRFDDPRDFQEVLDGICGALSAAHQRGVVHRDLKPDNLFLLASGQPRAKLVDFGLSRMAKTDKSITHSGMILGTPRYMAPEQIRDASSAGPSGDIYSIGVILHEALTGQSPYPAEDYGQLLGCVLEARIVPLADVRPELPPALGALIRRAMSADPRARFQTCDELADAFASAVGVPSRRVQIAATQRRAEPRRERKASLSSSLVGSKSSTLAFDASAARQMLEQMATPDAGTLRGEGVSLPHDDPNSGADFGQGGTTDPMNEPPPGALDPPPPARPLAPPPPARPLGAPAPLTPPPMEASPPLSHSPAPSSGSYAPAPYAQGPHSPAPHSPAPHSLAPYAPAPYSPAPVSVPPASAAGPAPHSLPPHGSTMLMSSVPPGAGVPSFGPASTGSGPRSLAPSGSPASFSSGASHGALPTKKKKRGFGLILFLVAMVFVVILSALGGLALRAYMRGELQLPAQLR
jgi:serine/threonine-protein kinase